MRKRLAKERERKMWDDHAAATEAEREALARKWRERARAAARTRARNKQVLRAYQSGVVCMATLD